MAINLIELDLTTGFWGGIIIVLVILRKFFFLENDSFNKFLIFIYEYVNMVILYANHLLRLYHTLYIKPQMKSKLKHVRDTNNCMLHNINK